MSCDDPLVSCLVDLETAISRTNARQTGLTTVARWTLCCQCVMLKVVAFCAAHMEKCGFWYPPNLHRKITLNGGGACSAARRRSRRRRRRVVDLRVDLVKDGVAHCSCDGSGLRTHCASFGNGRLQRRATIQWINHHYVSIRANWMSVRHLWEMGYRNMTELYFPQESAS
jgi:hypothetical protein